MYAPTTEKFWTYYITNGSKPIFSADVVTVFLVCIEDLSEELQMCNMKIQNIVGTSVHFCHCLDQTFLLSNWTKWHHFTVKARKSSLESVDFAIINAEIIPHHHLFWLPLCIRKWQTELISAAVRLRNSWMQLWHTHIPCVAKMFTHLLKRIHSISRPTLN